MLRSGESYVAADVMLNRSTIDRDRVRTRLRVRCRFAEAAISQGFADFTPARFPPYSHRHLHNDPGPGRRPRHPGTDCPRRSALASWRWSEPHRPSHKESTMPKNYSVCPIQSPWERQPDETPKAFDAFTYYRDLDPANRSLAAVLFRPSIGSDRVQLGAVGRVPHWSNRFRWAERVLAWDDFVDRESRRARINAVIEMQMPPSYVG